MKKTFIQTIETHLKAGTPILAINSDEEKRCIEEIRYAAWKAADETKIPMEASNATSLTPILKGLGLKVTFDPNYTVSGKTMCNFRYNFAPLWERYVLAKLEAEESGTPQAEKRLTDIVFLLNLGYEVIEYDIVTGFSDANEKSGRPPCDHSLEEALLNIESASRQHDKVFVFKDCHERLSGDADGPRRIVRNYFNEEKLTSALSPVRRHLVFLQPDWTVRRELQSCVSMVEFHLPTAEDLDEQITVIENSVQGKVLTCPADLRPQMVTALRGFTQMEAINALSFGMSDHKNFCPEMVTTLRRLQQASFAKDRVLTLVDDDDIASVSEVGGFENAIAFAEECKSCFTPEARALGLKRPKGCLLLGIPGSGKTMFAKVLARIMGLPLIIYDVSAQFGGLVGETEAMTRASLKKIKAKGPSVVLIDEADKVFSGSAGGYQGDGGVATRMLGYILQYMANENEESFMVMTMNRTLGVPKELLRAGRLDALYATTFPTTRERLEIFGIHLKKNGADLTKVDPGTLTTLVEATDQYVGAEIEQIVIKGVRMAFRRRKTLTPTHEELQEAMGSVKPLARLDEEGITAMNSYCLQSAIPVSLPEAESKVFNLKGRRQIRTNGDISSN